MERTGETIRQYFPTTLSAQSKMPPEGISNWFLFSDPSNTNRLTECQENTFLHGCRQARDLVHSALKRKTKLLGTPYAILTTPYAILTTPSKH